MWFEGVRSAAVRSEEVRSPGVGEIRVVSEFSGVSAGTEMLVYRGEVSAETGLDLPTFEGGFGFPVKHGYAITGRVAEVGEGVEDFAVGDPVFVLHPHQSEFTAPADLAVKLPEGVSLLEGIFFANLETALNIVHDTPAKLGETVVVAGQGVVGLLVTALLARSGVRVVAVEPTSGRRELGLEFGASVVTGPQEMESVVRGITGGLGADAVVEVSGVGGSLDAAIRCVASEGVVVAASWYGKKSVTLDLGGHFHRGRVSVVSSQVGSIAPALSARWSRRRRTETVLDLMTSLDLARLVSHRFPLEDAPEVYRRLDADEGFAEETVQVVFEYRPK